MGKTSRATKSCSNSQNLLTVCRKTEPNEPLQLAVFSGRRSVARRWLRRLLLQLLVLVLALPHCLLMLPLSLQHVIMTELLQ
jgi:hypothetical protein